MDERMPDVAPEGKRVAQVELGTLTREQTGANQSQVKVEQFSCVAAIHGYISMRCVFARRRPPRPPVSYPLSPTPPQRSVACRVLSLSGHQARLTL